MITAILVSEVGLILETTSESVFKETLIIYVSFSLNLLLLIRHIEREREREKERERERERERELLKTHIVAQLH